MLTRGDAEITSPGQQRGHAAGHSTGTTLGHVTRPGELTAREVEEAARADVHT